MHFRNMGRRSRRLKDSVPRVAFKRVQEKQKRVLANLLLQRQRNGYLAQLNSSSMDQEKNTQQTERKIEERPSSSKK